MDSVRRAETLTEQATESLRRAIVTGDLKPGELYSATELGQELGVSRTPIREAVRELSRLRMVAVDKNRGIRVLPTSVDALLEGFEVRLMLEVPLARKATERRTEADIALVNDVFEEFTAAATSGDTERTLRADRDFHTALLAIAGNTRAIELLREQRDMVLVTGVGTVPGMRTTVECLEDHRDLYDAFLRGDSEAAGVAMRRHILNTATLLIEQETRSRPEFGGVGAAERLSWLTP